MQVISAPSFVMHSLEQNYPAGGRYMKSTRDDAPYLPSNVDFVAANNGLSSAEDVRRVLMEASYMVMGLGGAHTDHFLIRHLGSTCRLALKGLLQVVALSKLV